ncbi:MAG: DUF4097 family beta strand repeat protein [Lachnospiraceae bacterium]|nr:DUF4097 family beta strand repeat protein [Lachnospiraceae bacterium]
MKKSTLAISIMFVAFLLLGCVFGGAGLLIGGGADLVGWLREGNLVGMRGVSIDSLVAPAIRVRNNVIAKTGSTEAKGVPETEDLPAGEGSVALQGRITELQALVDVADLKVEVGGSDYSLEYEDARGMTYSLEKGVLIISQREKTGVITDGGEIVLHLPSGTMLTDASFSVGAGDVDVDGLQAQNLTIRVGAGDFRLEDCEVGDLNAEVGLGNLKLEGRVTGNLTAEVGAGNLEMELEGSEKDHNYSISVAAGDVKVGDTHTSGFGAERQANNGADNWFILKCGLGNLQIEFDD